MSGARQAWLDLVRAPGALTVLGDTAVGALAAGRPLRGRRLALPVASVALYWSGMALNDWADRAVDAKERPERPIPSGRIAPGQALAAAGALSATGVAVAGLAGGTRALGTAVALSGAAWAYDVVLKPTPAAPLGMAVCRALDVLLGAAGATGGGWVGGGVPALALACHTLGVTALSRGEVHGARAADSRVALAATVCTAVLAGAARARSPRHRAAAALCAWGYAATTGAAQLAADTARPVGPFPETGPDPTAVAAAAAAARTATVAGIHAMITVQAALAARLGSLPTAALLLSARPLARRLSTRRSPT